MTKTRRKWTTGKNAQLNKGERSEEPPQQCLLTKYIHGWLVFNRSTKTANNASGNRQAEQEKTINTSWHVSIQKIMFIRDTHSQVHNVKESSPKQPQQEKVTSVWIETFKHFISQKHAKIKFSKKTYDLAWVLATTTHQQNHLSKTQPKCKVIFGLGNHSNTNPTTVGGDQGSMAGTRQHTPHWKEQLNINAIGI